MGSLGWARCYWCWRWQYNMYIPDWTGYPLCGRCMDLEEPPLYPNERQRAENKTSRLLNRQLRIPSTGGGLPEEATKNIASFLSHPMVP